MIRPAKPLVAIHHRANRLRHVLSVIIQGSDSRTRVTQVNRGSTINACALIQTISFAIIVVMRSTRRGRPYPTAFIPTIQSTILQSSCCREIDGFSTRSRRIESKAFSRRIGFTRIVKRSFCIGTKIFQCKIRKYTRRRHLESWRTGVVERLMFMLVFIINRTNNEIGRSIGVVTVTRLFSCRLEGVLSSRPCIDIHPIGPTAIWMFLVA